MLLPLADVETVPTEYRADLALLLEGADGGAPAAALVVEAQLGRDADKRWSWPVYLASLRARLRCDVALLVVTSDSAIAGWAATPIATGHPGWVLVPLVLGPQAVPVVRDATVAERSPELAVLPKPRSPRRATSMTSALGSTRIWSSRRSTRPRVLFWRQSWQAGTTSIKCAVSHRGCARRRPCGRARPGR